jgi:hypothetical protein
MKKSGKVTVAEPVLVDPVHNVTMQQFSAAWDHITAYAFSKYDPDGLSLCRAFMTTLRHAGELVLVFRPDVDTPTEKAVKTVTCHALENVAHVYAETQNKGGWFYCRWTCCIS